jgi:hypothetical protein
LDKAFFGIVRRFGLLIAFLALTATVGALAWGIMLYRTPVHSEIAKPRLDYQKFKESLRPAPANQENAQVSSEGATAQTNTFKTPFEKQFERFVQQIIANGNRYLAPEYSMREDRVRSSCKEMTDRFPADQHDTLALSLMEQFAKATAALADDPSNKSNVADASEKGKRWETFTAWIATELQTQLEAENARVRTEEAKAVADKAQAIQLAGAAGTAFVVFIFFTLMLVLIAIERNTRPISVSGPPEASTAATA